MSNAKDPEGSRFALVSVMSSEDATICIKNLDGFALNGHIMHVEKVLHGLFQSLFSLTPST